MIYCNITPTLSVLAPLVKSRHRSNVLSARYLKANRIGGKNLGAFFIRRHCKCDLYIIFTAVVA
jgi:hypothetical protein